MKNLKHVNSSSVIDQQLERIYDQYSPVMYNIAMQLTSSEKESEQILICMFKKISKQKLFEPDHTLPCVRFIKLTIETTYELFPKYKRIPIQLKQFQRSPILNKLLCENMSIKSFSWQNNISSSQSMQSLKIEMAMLLNIKKKYLIRVVTIPV